MASMRPGLLCPGKGTMWSRLQALRPAASMRPGLLCPGKVEQATKPPPDRPSFNEAGAVMPRKRPALKATLAKEAALQ